MASALAHELNQPWPPPRPPSRRPSGCWGPPLPVGDPQAAADIGEAMGLAASQTLRAGQIVRRLRDSSPAAARRRKPSRTSPGWPGRRARWRWWARGRAASPCRSGSPRHRPGPGGPDPDPAGAVQSDAQRRPGGGRADGGPRGRGFGRGRRHRDGRDLCRRLAPASRRRPLSGSSNPSSRPSRAAWASACRSAARSSRPTAGGSGPSSGPAAGRCSGSRCRPRRAARDQLAHAGNGRPLHQSRQPAGHPQDPGSWPRFTVGDAGRGGTA